MLSFSQLIKCIKDFSYDSESYLIWRTQQQDFIKKLEQFIKAEVLTHETADSLMDDLVKCLNSSHLSKQDLKKVYKRLKVIVDSLLDSKIYDERACALTQAIIAVKYNLDTKPDFRFLSCPDCKYVLLGFVNVLMAVPLFIPVIIKYLHTDKKTRTWSSGFFTAHDFKVKKSESSPVNLKNLEDNRMLGVV